MMLSRVELYEKVVKFLRYENASCKLLIAKSGVIRRPCTKPVLLTSETIGQEIDCIVR